MFNIFMSFNNCNYMLISVKVTLLRMRETYMSSVNHACIYVRMLENFLTVLSLPHIHAYATVA
jgi:hypothetical protein